MAQEGIRIIWKTGCKWHDTDYFVQRNEIKPFDVKLNAGDRVKVKYAKRWYNAEVAETPNTMNNEG